jgi:glycerol-3-phosphate cytidylyltransferase-like family protein
VILNSDDFLLRKKGFVFRPFADRKEILEAIKGVDEVVASVDEDQTVSRTLEQIKPDIFAKGGHLPGTGELPEAETCRKIGCKLVEDVGGRRRTDSEASWKVQKLGAEAATRLRIVCPYCDDHPLLREKCLYCKGTGKIVMGKPA